MVVDGPWPGCTTVASSSGRITSRSDVVICAIEPPGRSVRPMDPANSTSPENSTALVGARQAEDDRPGAVARGVP